MYNFYAKFAKILKICKSFLENLAPNKMVEMVSVQEFDEL